MDGTPRISSNKRPGPFFSFSAQGVSILFSVDNTICIISKRDKDKITFKISMVSEKPYRNTLKEGARSEGHILVGRLPFRGNMVFKKKNLLLELREDERKLKLRRLPSIPLTVIKWH